MGGYVGKGYSGAKNAAARMGQAATSAGRAHAILSDLAAGTATAEELGFVPSAMANADMEDVVDALVDAICREDITLDDAAGRKAVDRALSDVLKENQDANLLSMPEPLIREVWLQTLSNHCFENIMLDIGASLQNGAQGNPTTFNDRCVELRDFVLEGFREQVRAFERRGERVSKVNSVAVGARVIRQVMDVYEGWMQ